MSKALVIQGVDFSVNKLDTVVLSDPIPCTGLVLSQNAISITKVGNTVTLTATVTPSNTTDFVLWSSLDSNIASVNNGVITAKGVGTVTITATCGAQTATCNVTVTHVLTESDMWHANGWGAVGADLSATPPKNCVYEQANTRYRLYADPSVYTDNPTGKYRAFADKAQNPGYSQNAIDVPYGATQMSIAVPSGAIAMSIAWQNNALESGIYTDRPAFAAVTYWDNPISTTGISVYNVDLTELPSGSNSLVLNAIANFNVSGDSLGNMTITFA